MKETSRKFFHEVNTAYFIDLPFFTKILRKVFKNEVIFIKKSYNHRCYIYLIL